MRVSCLHSGHRMHRTVCSACFYCHICVQGTCALFGVPLFLLAECLLSMCLGMAVYKPQCLQLARGFLLITQQHAGSCHYAEFHAASCSVIVMLWGSLSSPCKDWCGVEGSFQAGSYVAGGQQSGCTAVPAPFAGFILRRWCYVCCRGWLLLHGYCVLAVPHTSCRAACSSQTRPPSIVHIYPA